MTDEAIKAEFLFTKDGGIQREKISFSLVASVAAHAVLLIWFVLEGSFQSVVTTGRVLPEPIAVSLIVLPEAQPVAKVVEAATPPAPPVPQAVLPPPPTPRPRSAAPQVAQSTIPPAQPAEERPLRAVPDAAPDMARQDQSAGTVAPQTNVRPAAGNPSPSYPGVSRQRGEEGQVILRVVVGPDGQVESLSVEQSSGFRRLDKAALDSVRHWRFEPARRGPLPVKGVVRLPIRFVLQ